MSADAIIGLIVGLLAGSFAAFVGASVSARSQRTDSLRERMLQEASGFIASCDEAVRAIRAFSSQRRSYAETRSRAVSDLEQVIGQVLELLEIRRTHPDGTGATADETVSLLLERSRAAVRMAGHGMSVPSPAAELEEAASEIRSISRQLERVSWFADSTVGKAMIRTSHRIAAAIDAWLLCQSADAKATAALGRLPSGLAMLLLLFPGEGDGVSEVVKHAHSCARHLTLAYGALDDQSDAADGFAESLSDANSELGALARAANAQSFRRSL